VPRFVKIVRYFKSLNSREMYTERLVRLTHARKHTQNMVIIKIIFYKEIIRLHRSCV